MTRSILILTERAQALEIVGEEPRSVWLRGSVCEFEVWYFDETGFSLTACLPYGWQRVGERIEVERSRGNQGKRQNVVGFMRWDGADFHAAAFEDSIDNYPVEGCFRAFAAAKPSAKPKLIILDNAPAHRGEDFEEALEELEQHGVFVRFLPSYSPELDLIKLLWRKIKYEWLPLDIYGSYQTMCELRKVLNVVLRRKEDEYIICGALPL